jgi:biopolymer transport protein ExbB
MCSTGNVDAMGAMLSRPNLKGRGPRSSHRESMQPMAGQHAFAVGTTRARPAVANRESMATEAPKRRFALVGLLALLVLAASPPRWQECRSQDEPPAEMDSSRSELQGTPNLFKHIIVSAGPVFGLLLLAISIGLVALIVLLAMDLRLAVAIPPDLIDNFTDTFNKQGFKSALEVVRGNNSYLGRVLAEGMARLQYGIEDAREVVFNTVESIKASKEQLIAYLATIGTLGPMIGLVGTVYGMIRSFMELGRGGSPNAAELANGISHALVVTLLGVALSVPAIFCHAFFRNRLIRISMDTANIADDLLTQMYHNARRAAAAPSDEGSGKGKT